MKGSGPASLKLLTMMSYSFWVTVAVSDADVSVVRLEWPHWL